MIRSSAPIASAMFPADDSDAMPSPRHVEYASIEWLTCGLQAVSSESAIAAESDTERVGVVGAVASVSLGIFRIAGWSSCCASLRGAIETSAMSASPKIGNDELRRNKVGSITTGV